MDLEIATLIAAGEHRRALRKISEAHATPVLRFCAGLVGSDAEAEELLQETLLQAWGALPRYRAEASVRAWLFGIARRVCIRHLRKRDRRARLFARWVAPAPPARRVDDPAQRREDADLVRSGLATLKPKLREAVLLRYQVGMDGPEIAASLGISRAAARKRVSLGIKELRRTLRPLLMEISPAAIADDQESTDVPTSPLPAAAGPRIVRT